MYIETSVFMNCYKSNTYCIEVSINGIGYKITCSEKAKTAKKPWSYKIEIVFTSMPFGFISVQCELNDSISYKIAASEIKKAKADIKTILSKIRTAVKELKNSSNDIEICPIILNDIYLDIMKFPTKITKILKNIETINDTITFMDNSDITNVFESNFNRSMDTYDDIILFLNFLILFSKKIQSIILGIQTIMDILGKDTAIDNNLADEIWIAGDEKYNKKNVQQLSEEDFKKIYLDLLSKNLSIIPNLLTFISNHGLPISDAYTYMDRNQIKEYYSDFQDSCRLDRAQNSLLTIKYLYELKELCYPKKKKKKKEEEKKEKIASLITIILNIMIHFDFFHLFTESDGWDDSLSPRTDSGVFIQKLFNEYIDITSKSPSSDKMLEKMIDEPYPLDETKTCIKFKSDYDAEQYRRLFKLTQILLKVCNEKEISLKELSKNPKEYERSILKHTNLEKFNTADLYKTAQCTFVDLLFEGLAGCTPKPDQNKGKTIYTLNVPTLLQALYLQLYTYEGELKRCIYCGSFFEVGSCKTRKHCKPKCRNNHASNRHYRLHKELKCTQHF